MTINLNSDFTYFISINFLPQSQNVPYFFIIIVNIKLLIFLLAVIFYFYYLRVCHLYFVDIQQSAHTYLSNIYHNGHCNYVLFYF